MHLPTIITSKSKSYSERKKGKKKKKKLKSVISKMDNYLFA